MSAETALNAALLADPAVAAFVGSGASARIYPDAVPQEAGLPSIAYQRVGTEPVVTIHSGIPLAENVTIELMCMSPDRSQADALANACQLALGAATFLPIDRRAEFDPDNEFRGTVITFTRFEQL